MQSGLFRRCRDRKDRPRRGCCVFCSPSITSNTPQHISRLRSTYKKVFAAPLEQPNGVSLISRRPSSNPGAQRAAKRYHFEYFHPARNDDGLPTVGIAAQNRNILMFPKSCEWSREESVNLKRQLQPFHELNEKPTNRFGIASGKKRIRKDAHSSDRRIPRYESFGCGTTNN